MPLTIFVEGGLVVKAKGDDPKVCICVTGFFRKTARAIDLRNGHLVEFNWRKRVLIDIQPEAEYQKQLADQAAVEAKQKKDQEEAQAKGEAMRAQAIKKSADEFIAQYGPDPAKWPENLRPKPKAQDN